MAKKVSNEAMKIFIASLHRFCCPAVPPTLRTVNVFLHTAPRGEATPVSSPFLPFSLLGTRGKTKHHHNTNRPIQSQSSPSSLFGLCLVSWLNPERMA
jgi:hypothetical protein